MQGSKRNSERDGGQFKKREHVYKELHGEGIVFENKDSSEYKVRFMKYKGFPDGEQIRNVKEDNLAEIEQR